MKHGTNYGDTTGCAVFFLLGAGSLIAGLVYAVAHFA